MSIKIFTIFFDDRGPLIKFYFFQKLKNELFFQKHKTKSKYVYDISLLKFEKMLIKIFSIFFNDR